MSRTFRRKNYEKVEGNSWRRSGTKTAGFYTIRDYCWRSESCVTYREPSREEYFEEYYFIHGESKHCNAWSPGRLYRKNRERELRAHNRQELHKFFKNPDYEPMIYETPLSHMWDWR